jgi:Protein of unknown function (DUF2950)
MMTELEEIINRRIGENELTAVANMRAYVDAQEEYGKTDRDEDAIGECARKLINTPRCPPPLPWAPRLEWFVATRPGRWLGRRQQSKCMWAGRGEQSWKTARIFSRAIAALATIWSGHGKTVEEVEIIRSCQNVNAGEG